MTPGSHGSTFGGNPLACAVANGVLDVVLEEGFLAHVRAMASGCAPSSIAGRRLPERGSGGSRPGPAARAALRPPNADISAELLARGMLALPAGENVLRLLPPLIIEEQHIDEAIAKLQDVFQDFAGREAAQ